MESVLQCDTFASFENFQQNDAFSILEDLQDRPQMDFGFNFPGESLELSAAENSPRKPAAVGEKRKVDSLENFWDSEYFLPSNDCNFVGTYAQEDYSYPSADGFDTFNVKIKNLDSGMEKSSSCAADHVHKKQKVEGASIPVPNLSSPPVYQRPNSSPSSPPKKKRRSREIPRRSTPIPILCPDASPAPISSLADPTLIPNVFEFKKNISELDETTRNIYRDTLLQLARNAEAGVYEPSTQNNGLNFESLMMRMMFSFSVPSISPSFFSSAAAAGLERSHLIANPNFYNNLQFVPIISSRSATALPSFRHEGKRGSTSAVVNPTALGSEVPSGSIPLHASHPLPREAFFQKNAPYSVPNFTLVKPFPMSSTSIPPSVSSFRGANDNTKQTLSRHLPIRVF